ncbi:unnamed protein product [Urochloa humidicola]
MERALPKLMLLEQQAREPSVQHLGQSCLRVLSAPSGPLCILDHKDVGSTKNKKFRQGLCEDLLLQSFGVSPWCS